MEWLKINDKTYRAYLPVFGTVIVETFDGKRWSVVIAATGYCDTLIDENYQSSEAAKDAADRFVEDRVRAFLTQMQLRCEQNPETEVA